MDGTFWKLFAEAIFRWGHVVAGVIWIGHLYFFNWVNAQLAKTYDADSKKKVVPELMPRALYWFRWGAAFTWITGFLLIGMVYYMGTGMMAENDADKGMNMARAAIIAFLVGPGLYDVLWKTVFKGKETIGVAVSFVVFAVLAWYLDHFLPGRSAFIHIGSMFGTTMAMNVWMRIWPAQRKIIAAIKEGKAPDADLVATAGLRSKHNTYMSVPLIFTMVSNHYPSIFSFSTSSGAQIGYAFLIVIVALGWLFTKWLYGKSAKPDAAKF
jgi:uncharacterized membrane protein